jgi:hypothetical protein
MVASAGSITKFALPFKVSRPASLTKDQMLTNNWDELGARAANADEAVNFLAIGSNVNPHRPSSWRNYAQALVRKARADGDTLDASISIQCEAIAAEELADLLENRLLSVELATEASTAATCEGHWGTAYQLQRRAMALVQRGAVLEAAHVACRSEESVQVSLTPQEQEQGWLSAQSMRQVFMLLSVCGLATIKDILPPALVAEAAAQFAKDSADASGESEPGSADSVGSHSAASATVDSLAHVETSDHAARGDRRIEAKLPLSAPYTNQSLCANPLLLPFVKARLSDAVEVDTFSAVASLAGARQGAWHADANPLFFGKVLGQSSAYKGQGEQEGVEDAKGGQQGQTTDRNDGAGGGSSGSSGQHLPPHGLVAVMPLVNLRSHLLADTNGPTEFVSGSHLVPDVEGPGFWKRRAYLQHQHEHDQDRAAATKTLARQLEDGLTDEQYTEDAPPQPPPPVQPSYAFPTPIIRPAAQAGDVVLFDLRLRHRGGANRSNQTRPIIYLSYVEGWWRDTLNFKTRQSADWAGLQSAATRKLFTRLDADRYVQALEDFVVANHGKDALHAMQDHSQYKQSELRI